MPKFIIKWDAGYGESVEEIEADTFEEASTIVYEMCMEEAENNVTYSAFDYTEELAEELGL